MEEIVKLPNVSEFGSVDPAPPVDEENLELLEKILLNENEPIFQRMRCIFTLRNIGGEQSVRILSAGFKSKSALLRHEIAYVMGQMQNSLSLPYLVDRLEDQDEHIMVRHEAAEAMGAIGNNSIHRTLIKFLNDPHPEISESCEVAIGLLNHCKQTVI